MGNLRSVKIVWTELMVIVLYDELGRLAMSRKAGHARA